MKYRLKAYSIWEFGKRVENGGIPHQEDSIFPAHNAAADTDRLFILCDGMGGHDAGEVASATVCETLSETIMAAVPDPEGGFSKELFLAALEDSFNALDAKDSGEAKKKMGTTMTFLKFFDEGYFVAHIGDSRVYQIRPGKTREETKIVFMTNPHSLVYELVRAGELTEEDARSSRQKNIITRAMQPNMEKRSKADIHISADIQPGDYFYMCSDGMLENMDNEQLCYFFSEDAGDDERKVESLTRATQENRDNHSAILVHILDVTDPIVIAPEPVPQAGAYAPLEGEVHDSTESPALPPRPQTHSVSNSPQTPPDYNAQQVSSRPKNPQGASPSNGSHSTPSSKGPQGTSSSAGSQTALPSRGPQTVSNRSVNTPTSRKVSPSDIRGKGGQQRGHLGTLGFIIIIAVIIVAAAVGGYLWYKNINTSAALPESPTEKLGGEAAGPGLTEPAAEFSDEENKLQDEDANDGDVSTSTDSAISSEPGDSDGNTSAGTGTSSESDSNDGIGEGENAAGSTSGEEEVPDNDSNEPDGQLFDSSQGSGDEGTDESSDSPVEV